jgi:hypothetical protein
MIKHLLKSPLKILFILTLVGALLRFINLYWGQPYWFHPDERNVASAVTRLQWPDQMDPEFFAYGTVPIYFNFFLVKFVQNYLDVTEDPFATAIKAGRIMSALLSTALIPLMYWITKRYFTFKNYSLLPITSSLLTTFTVGFIQYAHFGTFEIWLTIEYLLFLICTMELVKPSEKISPLERGSANLNVLHSNLQGGVLILFTGLLLGLAIGTKVTSLVLLPAIALAILVGTFTSSSFEFHSGQFVWRTMKNLLSSGLKLTAIVIIATITFFLTNPYALAPRPSSVTSIQNLFNLPTLVSQPDLYLQINFNPTFLHSINVEGEIARGEINTFYTRHFTDTIPGLYQLLHVYPFILSWPVLILGLLGMLWMGITSIKLIKRKGIRAKVQKSSLAIKLYSPLATRSTSNYLLLITFFLLQVAFIFFLYVKWTRYTIPTLPYLIIATSVFITNQITNCKYQTNSKSQIKNITSFKFKYLNFTIVSYLLLVIWHLLQGLSFFPVYLKLDSRVAAAEWASQHLQSNNHILSEVYDLGIIPFNSRFMSQITLFNFYDLDDSPDSVSHRKFENSKIRKFDVIIIPSRRIWKHTLDHPTKFPQAAEFYQDLFSGQLGYTKIAEFSNSPSPLFNFLTFSPSDETEAEETFSVFDHPTVQVWQK